MVSWRRIMSWLMSNVVVFPSPTNPTRPQVQALRTAATRASGLPEQSSATSTPSPCVRSRSARTGSFAPGSITVSAPISWARARRSAAIGGSRSTGDGRPLLEAHRVGERDQRAGGDRHERRVPAMPGHAVNDAAARTELRPADATVLALPAALVVMHHHALPDDGLGVGHAGAARRHHAARLVAGDDGPAGAAETEGGGGIAGGAVRVQVAPAHPRGLHGHHHLAGSGRAVRELTELELAIAKEHDAAHGRLLADEVT